MGSSNSFVGMSSVLEGAAGFAGGVIEGGAAQAQGEFQKQQYDFNASLADRQAAGAIARGDKQAARLKQGAKKLIGSQRVALAAQGVDVNSGSAADIQEETQVLSDMDALEIKNNAWREAWGFRVQASDMRSAGQYAKLAGDNKKSNSLLTGGLKFLSGVGRGAAEMGAFDSTPKKKAPTREERKASRDEQYFG